MDKPHTIIYEQNSTWTKQHKCSCRLTVPYNKPHFKLLQLDVETWHVYMTWQIWHVGYSLLTFQSAYQPPWLIMQTNLFCCFCMYSWVMKTIASDTSGVNYIYRSSHSQSNPSIKNSTICFSLVIFCLTVSQFAWSNCCLGIARRNAKVCEFEVADQIFRKDEMRWGD